MSKAKTKSALIDELTAELSASNAAQWDIVARFRAALDPEIDELLKD